MKKDLKNINTKWASFNRFEIELPLECVTDCSHGGSCDSDVAYWQKELKLNLDRKKMVTELEEYGAWDLEELTQLSNDELEEKIIWIGACNISEEIDHEELEA